LRFCIQAERLGDSLRGPRARRREDDRREVLRGDVRLPEQSLPHLAEDAGVAVLRLERAREALRKLLLARPPRAEELIRDRVRRDHLGTSGVVAEEHRGPRVAVALLDRGLRLAEPAI